MKLYSENKEYRLYNGNMLDMLEVIEPNSIDSIVTDPPYELNFMNKGWDNSGVAFQKGTWEKCFSVLKPGGYLLAFGGSRTFHRIACAIEDAGFEIRDTIMWIYGSGFPKSMNLGKAIESKMTTGSANTQDWKNLDGKKVSTGDWGLGRLTKAQGFRPSDYWEDKHLRVDKVDYKSKEGEYWDGWGTALKPSYEPIVVARKPCEGSCVDNVLKYGVGGINIDECRIGTDYIGGGTAPDLRDVGRKQKEISGIDKLSFGQVSNAERVEYEGHYGRFPANTILTYDDNDFDEVCGGFPYTTSSGGSGEASIINNFKNTYNGGWKPTKEASHLGGLGDSGSASRYFYCAKASKKDRDEGLKAFDDKYVAFSNQAKAELKRGNTDFSGDVSSPLNAFNKVQTMKNTHPTVKPCDLMQYLVRLVTPNGGTVLDPFNGSGSTGKACMYENRERGKNYKYIGIELTEEYLPISRARIEYAQSGELANIFDSTNKEEKIIEQKPITKSVQLW